MLGAIIGDIVGSRWEFDPTNNYNFEFFSNKNDFTDDTICTIAVADAILKHRDYGESIHEWCQKYPHPMGGYGCSFNNWVHSEHPQAYGSYGNGAAMRVSPIAWAFLNAGGSLLKEAELAAACSHNHPEGIKGAQAVAVAIHDCRELHVKYQHIDEQAIQEGLKRALELSDYDIHIDINKVKNHFDETCQGTVPVAFWIISQSKSFEDAIRKAVCLGADADTLGAIVGGIAEVIWGIPEWMKKKAISYLPDDMTKVLRDFRKLTKEAYPKQTHQVTKDEAEANKKKEEYQVIMFWKLGLGHMGKYMNGENPMPKKDKQTDATSWECKLMPIDEHGMSSIEMNLYLSESNMNILRKGHLPEAQEDHWFMYCDDEYIRYYRSWTGVCAFEAHYHQDSKGYVIDHLRMNHDLAEFGVNGDNAGMFLFRYLIIAEIGLDASKAWKEYLKAWEDLNALYSK